MNLEVVAPCINYYTDVYDADNFISLIEEEASKGWPRLEWDRAIVDGPDGPRQSDYRSSLNMSLDPLLAYGETVELKDIQVSFMNMFHRIDECIWDYRNQYELPLARHDEIQVLKYINGGEYKAHVDAGGHLVHRQMSMVAYLNDEYEGGELEFINFDLKIKPQKGSVILFPSAFPYAHIAHPVDVGTKYAMVTWFS